MPHPGLVPDRNKDRHEQLLREVVVGELGAAAEAEADWAADGSGPVPVAANLAAPGPLGVVSKERE